MREQLFKNQKALEPQDRVAHGVAVGLDIPAYKKCLDSGKYQTRVRKDMEDGQTLGVMGTPSFFLGTFDEKDPGKVNAVTMLSGALPYNEFKQALDKLMPAPAGTSPKTGE